MIAIDLDGNTIEGDWPAAPGVKLHLALHKARTDVNVAVHNHPIWSTVYANLRRIPGCYDQSSALGGGKVVVVDEYTGGVDDVDNAAIAVEAMGDADIALLAGHGLFVLGDSVREVHQRAVAFEQRAHHAYFIENAGGDSELHAPVKEMLGKAEFFGFWEAMARRELLADPELMATIGRSALAPMSRLFTDDELRRLERTPHEQVADAIAAGDDAALQNLVSTLERSFAGTVTGTRNWIAHTIAFVAREFPAEQLAGMVAATQALFLAYPDAVAPDAAAEPLAVDAGGDVLARFDAMEDHYLRQQDLYRDWLSALLSYHYRTLGVDELERVLRYSAEQTLMPWMPTDTGRPPEKRLPSWVRMFQGHFSGVRVEEDDEKFTLIQDPCGTCSRQIEQGRYGPPLDLAVVDEIHAATWFRGETPIYRAHVPLWHIKLARRSWSASRGRSTSAPRAWAPARAACCSTRTRSTPAPTPRCPRADAASTAGRQTTRWRSGSMTRMTRSDSIGWV